MSNLKTEIMSVKKRIEQIEDEPYLLGMEIAQLKKRRAMLRAELSILKRCLAELESMVMHVDRDPG